MPELPEVEVVRRGLERHVVGRTISSAQVLHPRAVRRHAPGPDDFSAALSGLTVTGTGRRGKYLWLPVMEGTPGERSVAGDALLAHLGMRGQLLLGDPERPLSPHVRIRFTFADAGPDLRFTDQRTFGHMAFVAGGAVLPSMIAHIAPDPMDPDFDEAAVIGRLRSRHAAVKGALLDQSLGGGIGDIYARRALQRGELHWAPPAAGAHPGRGRAAAGGRARGPGRGADRRRHLVRQPVRERQRGERVLRQVTRCLRPRGRAVPTLRDRHPAGSVHEQVRLQLPGLPAAYPPQDPPRRPALTSKIVQLDLIPAGVRSLIGHLARTHACLRVCAHSGHSVWRTHYNGEGYSRPRWRA